MPSAVQVIEVTADHAFGHAGEVLVYVWRRQTTLAGIARLREYVTAGSPRERFMLGAVEPGAALPEPEARDALAAMLKDGMGGRAVASAVVFEGSGLQDNLVRIAVMTLRLLARQRYPHKIFSTTGAALKWLTAAAAEAGAGPFPADQAGAALAELRALPPH
jgi:hypothetical protein